MPELDRGTASRNLPSPGGAAGGWTLELADGCVWRVTAEDAAAARLVDGIGAAMQATTEEAAGRPGRPLRELTLAAAPSGHPAHPSLAPALWEARAGRPARIVVPPSSEGDRRVPFQMPPVTTFLGLEAQARGGALVHGGLAVRPGPDGPAGALLAGCSGSGKSTASSRLPLPWVSWSDDLSLLARCGDGSYRVHPWPTWSLFLNGGTGGSWPSARSVPLRAVFFLEHAPEDRAEPLTTGHAVAELFESFQAATLHSVRFFDLPSTRAVRGEWLEIACAVAARVPAFHLRLTLTGSFWDELDRCLAVAPDLARRSPLG